MSIIKRSTPKDRFYAPLRKVASDYVPMLLGRIVLEAGTCQALLSAFIDLLQDDRRKIIDNKCYFLGKDGEIISLYGDLPPEDEEEDGFIKGR